MQQRKVLVEKELEDSYKPDMMFENMSFFKEASHRKVCGLGYSVSRFKILWSGKTDYWNWFGIEYGIRRSDFWQIFPIWNISHNGQRGLKFGFWKLYFDVIYYRKSSFNQNRKLFLRKKLWKFYQLLF